MKLKVLLLVLLVGLVGYAIGTENGRRQRDELLRKVRRQAPVDEAMGAAQDVVDDVVDLTSSAADQAETAVLGIPYVVFLASPPRPFLYSSPSDAQSAAVHFAPGPAGM